MSTVGNECDQVNRLRNLKPGQFLAHYADLCGDLSLDEAFRFLDERTGDNDSFTLTSAQSARSAVNNIKELLNDLPNEQKCLEDMRVLGDFLDQLHNRLARRGGISDKTKQAYITRTLQLINEFLYFQQSPKDYKARKLRSKAGNGNGEKKTRSAQSAAPACEPSPPSPQPEIHKTSPNPTHTVNVSTGQATYSLPPGFTMSDAQKMVGKIMIDSEDFDPYILQRIMVSMTDDRLNDPVNPPSERSAYRSRQIKRDSLATG